MTALAPHSAALAAYVALIAVQRFAELEHSARNAGMLRRRGAVEWGRAQFPWFAALHTAYPILLAAEVLGIGAQPWGVWPWWLAGLCAALALRAWAVDSLGEFWNVRVWVVPGMRPVRRGPYRWLRHPNYLAVALEFVCAPMALGAWRTALAAGIANAILLGVRIRTENRAIAWAEAVAPPPAVAPDLMASP